MVLLNKKKKQQDEMKEGEEELASIVPCDIAIVSHGNFSETV